MKSVNNGESQEIEIPAEWDVTVSGAERRGYRRGVEEGERLGKVEGILALLAWAEEHKIADRIDYSVGIRPLREAARLLAEAKEGK